jgi:hypothetical protein
MAPSTMTGMTGMTGLSWFWIGVALTAPAALGGLIAYPIWLKNQPILGNLAGSAVMFSTALGLIMREHLDLERLAQACIDDGVPCFPVPSAFARYALYSFIALVEVMLLFGVSLKVEARIRSRGYAPEWRRG